MLPNPSAPPKISFICGRKLCLPGLSDADRGLTGPIASTLQREKFHFRSNLGKEFCARAGRAPYQLISCPNLGGGKILQSTVCGWPFLQLLRQHLLTSPLIYPYFHRLAMRVVKI